ncbi:hypothetical protein E2320_013202, partial [Naja naja]
MSLTEMKSLSSQPSGAQQQPRPFLEPAIHNAVYGRHKFLSFASQPGPQKKKQLVLNEEYALVANQKAREGKMTERSQVPPEWEVVFGTKLPLVRQAFDATAEVAGQPRFPSFASCAQQTFADTIWEEGLSNQAPQVAVERIRQRQSRLESGLLHSCPSCPAFFEEGRIYSSRNILRGLHFLGLQLFQLLRGPRQVQI